MEMEKEFEQIDKAGNWAAIYQVREQPGARRQALRLGRGNLPLRTPSPVLPLGLDLRVGPAAGGFGPTAAEPGALSLCPSGGPPSLPDLSIPFDPPAYLASSLPAICLSSPGGRGSLRAQPSHPDPDPLPSHSLSPGVGRTPPPLPFLDGTTSDSLPLSPWEKGFLLPLPPSHFLSPRLRVPRESQG